MGLPLPKKAPYRRRHQPKHSVFQSPVPGIPGNSPPSLRKAGAARAHERFGSGDPTGSTKLSLTAEDSSVTSLPALRKAANSVASMGPLNDEPMGICALVRTRSRAARVGRTLSRERKAKPKPQDTDDDDDIDTQVSAV
ncbi:uncharacterized protein LOC131891326 [Tigriopus californicus]|uniref:uncharacterized protein LOC131891326 n=1 Tax=Tigriopus californicus TaxID=6832 RepID=UPI0027DA033D|nr:uncharacterized protein LOC131891326 [Tigriopus californicus]